MGKRVGLGVAFGCAALLLAGCGRSTPVEDPSPAKKAAPATADAQLPAPKKAAPAGPQRVTLEVEGMTERLNLV